VIVPPDFPLDGDDEELDELPHAASAATVATASSILSSNLPCRLIDPPPLRFEIPVPRTEI